jgi:hypothetical protein
MKRWITAISPGLRCEEGRGFSQDLSLLAELSVLTLELAHAGPLVAGQTRLLAGVDVVLVDPVAQGLIADPEVGGDPGDRLA